MDLKQGGVLKYYLIHIIIYITIHITIYLIHGLICNIFINPGLLPKQTPSDETLTLIESHKNERKRERCKNLLDVGDVSLCS